VIVCQYTLTASFEPELRQARTTLSLEMCEVLIANGADINAKDNNGNTPLHKEVSDGQGKDVIKYLIANRANVSVALQIKIWVI